MEQLLASLSSLMFSVSIMRQLQRKENNKETDKLQDLLKSQEDSHLRHVKERAERMKK